ncbi:uncharacterized protein LOC135811498 [Sycon ciliatum]|uniref:uncharacterized protein LOC135811498 n=1 Tax=Sycon ciliatum TaxID=27933 RepID=UPI0031F610FE
MPKRKTRAAPSRKAAPKIGEPSNDEAKQDKDDRAEAIAIYKEEFEQELKVREKKLEKELKELTKSLKAAHRTTLISLPSFVQKMTVAEFVAFGGDVDAAAKAHVENSVAEPVMPITKSTSSTSASGLTDEPLSDVTNRQMPAPPACVDGGGVSSSMETPMETSRTRAKRKRVATETETTNRATTTTRRTTRQATLDIGDTPAPTAPTPAFDSRLPGLRQGTGRTRAKTKRGVTITVNPDSRDDVMSLLDVATDCIPDIVEDDAMMEKCRDLQARLTMVLSSRNA